jgi:hypothetical protein
MSASPKPVFERDPVKLDASHYKVELENDRVRVVRIKYAGKEKSVMHQHPPGVGIFLTDARSKGVSINNCNNLNRSVVDSVL